MVLLCWMLLVGRSVFITIRHSRHIITKDTTMYYRYIFCYDLKIEETNRNTHQIKFGKREDQSNHARSGHFISLLPAGEFFQISQTARSLEIKAIF